MSVLHQNPSNGILQKKWIEPDQIESKVNLLKSEGKTIATINGSFDLLHAGHLEILREGKKQADVLLVALNSDASIQAYKSPLRPIISLEYRAMMMTALEMVDYVTCFGEADPRALLAKIKPDVHVNGSEYGPNCIEADVVKEHGGRMHIVSLVQGLSTSQIIKRIIDTCA